MIVRPAHAADIPQLLDLYRELVGDGALGSADQVAQVLTHPGTQIWCVEVDGTLSAMVTLHILPNVTQGGRPYALIENVVTLSRHQRQGFGRLAMQAAMEAAWSADAYKIMLLTGRSASARGFYEKLGFSAEEKWGMTLRRAPLRQIRPSG